VSSPLIPKFGLFRYAQPLGTSTPANHSAVFLTYIKSVPDWNKHGWPATGFLHFEDDFSKALVECWRISSMPDL
jgi:hypothetical protein